MITNNYRETQELGEKFAAKLKNGGTVALFGNLGSGKTTFVQGLARGLGIKGRIISPTFIIVRKYEVKAKSKKPVKDEARQRRQKAKSFYHIDLYRIESEKDLQGLGIEEIINDPTNIIAIEWPEKIEKILPEKRLSLYFKYLEDDKRQITES
jgi:tRNA threonylcarbamoyladenosine biosynthesis protein TsaE